MTSTRRLHWAEYACEAIALGLFMLSATAFATLFQHPDSPLTSWVPAGALGRVPMALAMGGTAVALIHSPAGRRSGAHMNPAVTFTFARLGKITVTDAAGYVVAQFAGGIGGTVLADLLLLGRPGHPTVHYIVTMPIAGATARAFVGEAAISFVMMLTVLAMSNHRRTAPHTGLAAGSLVALFILVEAPVSGMSMNPARTFGPALVAGEFPHLWIYFTAPFLGMLSAAELFVGTHGLTRVRCAKLHHAAGDPCIFHCRHAAALTETHA